MSDPSTTANKDSITTYNGQFWADVHARAERVKSIAVADAIAGSDLLRDEDAASASLTQTYARDEFWADVTERAARISSIDVESAVTAYGHISVASDETRSLRPLSERSVSSLTRHARS